MTIEQIQTEIKIVDYSMYCYSQDKYMIDVLEEKRKQLEKYLSLRELLPPSLTFLGTYSYDYRLSQSYSTKIRWENDLKIWIFEKSQISKQNMSLENCKEDSQEDKSNSNRENNQQFNQKSILKKQTYLRWQDKQIKEKETEDILNFSQSLKTQYSVLKLNIRNQKRGSQLMQVISYVGVLNSSNKDTNASFQLNQKLEQSCCALNDIFQFNFAQTKNHIKSKETSPIQSRMLDDIQINKIDSNQSQVFKKDLQSFKLVPECIIEENQQSQYQTYSSLRNQDDKKQKQNYSVGSISTCQLNKHNENDTFDIQNIEENGIESYDGYVQKVPRIEQTYQQKL